MAPACGGGGADGCRQRRTGRAGLGLSGATSVKKFRRRRAAPAPLEKTAHGIELAQIQQRTVKLEYIAPSCCLVRDLPSHFRQGRNCWLLLAGLGRPGLQSQQKKAQELGMSRLKRPSNILRRTIMQINGL